jgi:hypothetical protein
MNDYDYLDEDEKQEYSDSYVKAINGLTSGMDKDARALIFDEMQTMRYNPTPEPALDAELNFMKAEKTLSSKTKKMGRGMSSFLDYKARTDGKTPAQVKRWANKTLREKD